MKSCEEPNAPAAFTRQVPRAAHKQFRQTATHVRHLKMQTSLDHDTDQYLMPHRSGRERENNCGAYVAAAQKLS